MDPAAADVVAGLSGGELAAAGGGVAGALALLVRLWPLISQLVTWLAAKSKNEQLSHAVATITAYAQSRVGQLALAALADGRIDAAEAKAITEAAVKELPAPVLETAKTHFGDGFPAWIAGVVAQLLTDEVRKHANAAGAAAAAKVQTLSDAEHILRGGAA